MAGGYGDGDGDGDSEGSVVGEAVSHSSGLLAQSGGGAVVGVMVAVGDDPGAHVCPTDGLDDGEGAAVGGDGCAVFVFGSVSWLFVS